MAEDLYAVGKRRPFNLEPRYSQHVSAMTTEGLHEKADIAAELAFRDSQIDKLRRERDQRNDDTAFVAVARSQLRHEKFAQIQKLARMNRGT